MINLVHKPWRGCFLLSAGDNSRCDPHLPWLSTRPRGRHYKQWGCTCPSLFFYHGQLYVAFSRCGSRRSVRVLVRGGSRAALNGALAGVYTKNVVYREVLQLFFFWVLGFLGSPLDSQIFFRARGWVGLDCIRLKMGLLYISNIPSIKFPRM